MLVLTAVIAVPMTQVDWNGTEASTQAHSIDTLLNVMIVLSSFVFSIVLVMLGYSLWKYRAKPGDESDGEPIHGNTRLEIAWTVIPTVIVLFGAVYSAVVLAPNRLGTYNVVCTELCGYGHSAMRALVHVWPKPKFDRWLSNQAQVQKNGGGPSFPTLNPGSGVPGAGGAGTTTSTTG